MDLAREKQSQGHASTNRGWHIVILVLSIRSRSLNSSRISRHPWLLLLHSNSTRQISPNTILTRCPYEQQRIMIMILYDTQCQYTWKKFKTHKFDRIWTTVYGAARANLFHITVINSATSCGTYFLPNSSSEECRVNLLSISIVSRDLEHGYQTVAALGTSQSLSYKFDCIVLQGMTCR